MLKIRSIKNSYSKHKTPLQFLNSTVLLQIISLVTGLVAYRYITPEYLGIWATFTTFTTLAPILRLGIPNGMNRELPYYLGKGEVEKAYMFASTTLYYSILNMFLLGIAGLSFLIFHDYVQYGEFSDSYIKASIVFVFTIVVEPYTTYLSGTFRTSDSFNKLSRNQYVLALINIISIPMIIYWGYDGYLGRAFLLSFINLLLLHFRRPLPSIKPRFSFQCFKQLFLVGFTLYLTSYISTFIDSIPRLMIINYGTAREVGLFSPILICLTVVILIPNTLSNYLYPKFSYAFGNGLGTEYLWKKMKPILLLSLGLGIIAAFVIYFLIDYIVLVFPNYKDSVNYIKIVSFAMAFIGQVLMSVICVVLKNWKWLWINTVSKAVVQIVSIFVLKNYIADIVAVSSWSICITYVTMFFISFSILYHVTHLKKNQ